MKPMEVTLSERDILLPVAEQGPLSPFIRLVDVVKSFRTSAGELTALKGVTLEIERGQFTVIFGRSGAGKSTLVNVMTGVDRVTSGQVWVGDTPVHLLDEDRLALWRGTNVGVVYQSFQLLPMLSLLDNVMLPMDFSGLYSPQKSLERAEQLLADVGLAEHRLKTPTRISGGQQQRVAVARALANDPPLLVADEPTGNLDSTTAAAILDLFEELVARGKTVVMVTHDLGLAGRGSRTVRIDDGRIVG
jgi:putative ABC transport system ATP-binding protein